MGINVSYTDTDGERQTVSVGCFALQAFCYTYATPQQIVEAQP